MVGIGFGHVPWLLIIIGFVVWLGLALCVLFCFLVHVIGLFYVSLACLLALSLLHQIVFFYLILLELFFSIRTLWSNIYSFVNSRPYFQIHTKTYEIHMLKIMFFHPYNYQSFLAYYNHQPFQFVKFKHNYYCIQKIIMKITFMF